ncbi:hypothetical protein niasHT_018706 [Heterodera trifolii]|uniref:BTB domain-containing protein n=1 Tax=Heterodera trifolii TaxID=157864 RepID=A0ABD2LB93_9BILA
MLSFIYTEELNELNGDNHVPAHKLILKHASDVFEAVFRFDSQNTKANNDSVNCPVVEVPDVEAAAFKVMLNFIYTAELSELNGDNDNIPGLFNPCLDVPVSELRNVFLAYAQACLFDLEDFAHDCLIFGTRRIANPWRNFYLESTKNRRAVLGPALFKIRFPLFSKEEFLKTVPSKVLTAKENHWRNWTFGTISMDIEKVSELERHPMGSYRFSNDTVYIKDLSWKILAQIKANTKSNDNNEKCLAIFLWCKGPSEAGENWSCKCSATIRIVSKMDGVENSVGKFYDIAFNSKPKGHGFNFIPFVELMEPSKGFYDQIGDKITVTIDFAVGEPKADKSISNSSKSKGTLFMDIEKMSEFAREVVFSERRSESVTYINGFPWKIWAQINQRTENTDNNGKWLDISLQCAAPKEDINWSCKCLATLRVVSQKSGVANYTEEFGEEITFNSESVARGFPDFISFAELMDPEKGFYDQSEDKVTVAIDVTVDEAKTEHK